MRLERDDNPNPCPRCGGPEADLVKVSRGWPLTPEEAADPDFEPPRFFRLACPDCGHQWTAKEQPDEDPAQ